LFTHYYPSSKWRTKPSVLAMSNGVRKLIVLLPEGDPARAWQVQDWRGRPELFELPLNLLLYAVDHNNLRYRGERFYLPDQPEKKPAKAVVVLRVQYPGSWDPEPGGWRRMNNWMIETKSISLTLQTAELGKGQLGHAPIAFLTGSRQYAFNAAQEDELKKFINAGGTMVIDSAGGNSPFATSIETALNEMYPKDRLAVLPPSHPLFTAGGGPADEILYRTFARQAGVGQDDAPRLQGITLNGRLAVIYSREDLSEGLVGQPIDGINGYSPTTATNLMSRILIYASAER
jgi:hypothetical protein